VALVERARGTDTDTLGKQRIRCQAAGLDGMIVVSRIAPPRGVILGA
jgi:hypothetical protein